MHLPFSHCFPVVWSAITCPTAKENRLRPVSCTHFLDRAFFQASPHTWEKLPINIYRAVSLFSSKFSFTAMPLTAVRPLRYDEATAYHVDLWDLFRAHASSLLLLPWNMSSLEWGQPFREVRSLVWIWSLAGAPGGLDTANNTRVISSIT